MSKTKTTISGGEVFFFSSHNAGTSISLATTITGNGKNKEVWSRDFENASYPLVFLAPASDEADAKSLPVLPANHPIWSEIDELLAKIWSENDFVDPAVDDAWLDETRASWNERLEDLYDEFDTRK